MIYLDSSALVKLVLQESESVDLAEWLATRQSSVRVSSALVRVEVLRSVTAREPEQAIRARGFVSSLALVPLTGDVLDDAGAMPYVVRSLDAIHLTSALRVREAGFEAFVAYDHRLLDAAEQAGLPTASPGAA